MSPPDNHDWSTFQVFEDPCVLDRAVFSGGKLDENVRGFCTWVNKLRAQLQKKQAGLGGIPAELADDVLHLLNHFFPAPDGVDGTASSFVDISYGQPSPFTPVCVAKPITVSFHNHPIEITDGPTALGYIFSIARMPSQVRPAQLTWSNYVVPLLAIYSRCLYLAYIVSQDWQPRLMNVPWMACAMYFNDAQGRLAMLLGSTYAPSSADSGQLAAANGAKRRAMALWRADHALAPGLSFYNPGRTLKPPQYPPVMVESIIDGLFALLRGQTLECPGGVLVDPPKYQRAKRGDWRTVIMDQAAGQASFENLATQHSTAWKAMQPPPPIDILPLPSDQVYAHPELRKSIRAALADIMKIRWTLSYRDDRDAPSPTPLDAAIIKAIQVCFLPHMFPALPPIPPATRPTPNASLPEIPAIAIPGQALAVGAAVLAIYTPDCRTRVLDMLERFHSWVEAGDDGLGFGQPFKARFGRCCETYPVAALMPTYFPYRVLPAAADNPQEQDPTQVVTQVHGLALQPRYFNNAMCGMLAGQGPPENPGRFDSHTLNAMHEATGFNLYRKPCRNCAALLPRLDVTVDEKYHEHLDELYGSDVATRVREDST